MSWTPSHAWAELADSDLPPVLRTRCLVLTLRMRIERIVDMLPSTTLVGAPGGRTALRLWALVALAAPEDRWQVRDRVRQVSRVYGLTSDYLHSRRAAAVPPRTELAAWLSSVDALEELVSPSRRQT